MVYKIADFYFECNGISEHVHKMCKEYLCSDPERIDCTISVTKEDVDRECSLVNEKERANVSRPLFESMALQRKVCAFVLSRDAFLMHGVAIAFRGEKGYIFTAQSGTGKTTHVRFWKKAFGKDVSIVNGDKPILRFLDGKVYAYGTPWNGKEGYGMNTRIALDGVCFLKRGESNVLSPLSEEQVIPLLFSQIMITDSADLAKQLELADRFVQIVPFYEMRCTMSVEAALVAFAGMQK